MSESAIPNPQSAMGRREAVGLMGGAVLAVLDWTPAEAGRALSLAREARARGAGQGYAPTFFTTHEWQTVRVLVDLVIPRDARSGSATDAGVPEFMDFLMTDGSDQQRTAMRGGLAGIDIECRKRFGKALVDCAEAERTAVLDAIAWPAQAPPDLTHGVAFFNRFRDLTAAGFFSSKMGVADLQYQGNTFVMEWTGCPPEALAKLGLTP